MKPLIVVYSLLMMLFCCSCGSDHPDRRVTEENAYEGVSNYCHQTDAHGVRNSVHPKLQESRNVAGRKDRAKSEFS